MLNDKKVGRLFDFDIQFFDDLQDIGPIFIKQIGEIKIEPKYEIPYHIQNCHEISYVVSGEGCFYSENERFKVSRGCVHIAPSGTSHRIISDVDSPLRYIFIGFDFAEEFDDSLSSLKEIFSLKKGLLFEECRDMSFAFESMISEEYNKSSFYIEMLKASFMQILIGVYRKNNSLVSQSLHFKEQDGLGQRIYAVVKYIDNNITKISGVSDLAKDLGYSHSYISHIFKEKMGITLQGYIIAKRIELSLQYLRNQSLSISQIAQLLEYDTVQSYGKAFKKIMKCSPSEYRNQIVQRGMAFEEKQGFKKG